MNARGSQKLQISILSVLCLSGAAFANAACTPEKMVKAVFVNATPGLDPKAFVAQPKTLYRLGHQYGRIEEVPDPANDIQGLIVVNEPDLWMVNLRQQAGTHMLDTGAPYYFRAPIFTDPAGSPFFLLLEFGCEVAYVKAAGAKGPVKVNLVGRDWDRYDVARGQESIMLLAAPGTDAPYVIAFYRDDAPVFAIRYAEYSNELPADLRLFEQPTGIKYQETKK